MSQPKQRQPRETRELLLRIQHHTELARFYAGKGSTWKQAAHYTLRFLRRRTSRLYAA